jgi:hypothetical protein
MTPIKESIPLIRDNKNEPIAGIFFIAGKRVICKVVEMSEEELIEFLEGK